MFKCSPEVEKNMNKRKRQVGSVGEWMKPKLKWVERTAILIEPKISMEIQ